MSGEADKGLLDELNGLLTEQIMLARRDRLGDVEMGCRKVGALLEQITRTGALEKARFAAERERLTGLYSDLCLILAARKAETGEELNRMRRGRKAVRGYAANI
jgi:hypothetical protein